ncbi:MAG: hypothetical protein HC851_11735 [Acaryochloris sp. RU_4_1]|nr:hypothetical protein [Acaryochloris sp. RU_4_1]NJN39422.1 hypothetical protein [Acaryochloridaceae cyanobacterium CSU_3_4]NJR56071.1 hypothetical protein [Acaryochloris sp. CRU_2_0]
MAQIKHKPPVQVIDTFLAQRDIFSALLVWIILEGFSFVLLPNFTVIPGDNKTLTWVLVSVPLGMGGAFVIGLCSSWLQYCQLRMHKTNPHKKLWILLGNLGSWLGLVGIGLPLITVGVQLWLMIVHGIDT